MKNKIFYTFIGAVIIIGGGSLCKEMISINKDYNNNKEILDAIFKYTNYKY